MSGWERNVRRVTPYVPGEQPAADAKIIKLNTNENPYPPSPRVLAELRAILDEGVDALRLYPDPAVSSLRAVIANAYGVSAEQVFVGVGSDDVLAMCFLTFFNGDKPVFFPDITYSFYDVWAEEFRIPYETKPLREDFTIAVSDYVGDVSEPRNGGIVLPNPNAPTGISEGVSVYEEIIANNPQSVVIIDEAYVDFADDGAGSVLPLVEKYDNLLVVQTLSKSRSLAGLRIGFAIGSEKLISYLNDVKYGFNSYTIDRITMRLATAAISDRSYMEETATKIRNTREWTRTELAKIGFSCPPSQANFLFVTHETVPAFRIFEELKEAGIYVRYFNKPRINNYLRVTIGTDEEMQSLVAFLRMHLPEMARTV